MIDYLVIVAIVLWLIYGVAIALTKKRKHDYSLYAALICLIGFGYFYFDGSALELYHTVYNYATLGLFALWLIVDNVILLFKKNVSEFDFYHLEKELAKMKNDSETLRQRFISTIELFKDGIAFIDDDQIFGSDRYIELFGLEENEFAKKVFESRVIKEDLLQYNMVIDKLTKRNPIYTISYRIKKDNQILWMKEHGKALYLDKEKHIISIVRPMDVQLFPKTEVDVLNHLPTFKKMYDEMQKLTRTKKSYHLVVIQLSNIPKINEKFGRDFGDLMMGEYLSKLRFKFIKDNRSLFRISGIQFGLLIKDDKKFELLDRALVGTGELLTMRMKFGGVSEVIYPNLGISVSPYEGKSPEDVYQEALTALKRTEKESYSKSYAYYEN
jgi:GGDEF domain-containing protein